MAEMQRQLPPMRLQSQLGTEVVRRYKEGSNIVRLSLARVVKVNYKYNTVDVVTTLYKNTLVKNPVDEGRFSARLPVSFGGRTPDGQIYGTNTLVTEGSLVLIGFLEGNKDFPIVLNIYGDTDNQSMLTRTTFSGADASDEDIQRELWQLFTLYPSMTYHNVDGRGSQEVTFSGKTFMYITDSDQNNDYINDVAFDYDHLPSSRYANGELIEPKSAQSPTLLYVHQGIYERHRVTFFIKSDGTVRVGSRHINGTGVTFYEMKTDGTFEVVQKRDTVDPEEDSNRFSKFGISKEGSVILQAEKNIFEITNKGIFVNGKPIGSIGGGVGSIEELVNGSDTLEIKDGKIELKEENTVINELKDKISKNEASWELTSEKISEMVSKEEIKIDLKDIREYAEGLVAGVNDELEDITTSLTDLDSYIDGAFYDGIVSEAEAKAIETYINALNKEKTEVDTKYNEIHSNKDLPETNKMALESAKIAYDNKHDELIQVINIAIQDGKTREEEKLAVDNTFKEYASVLSDLRSQFETAIDAIANVKALEATKNAKDYTNVQINNVSSEIERLAGEIALRVKEEEYTKKTEEITTQIGAIGDQVGEVQEEVTKIARKVTYNAVIISTQGNIFKNGNIDTTLFCRVYHGDEDVTDTIDESRFKWSRISDDARGDQEWNSAHSKGTKTLHITDADVPNRATFNCDILEETATTTTTTS